MSSTNTGQDVATGSIEIAVIAAAAKQGGVPVESVSRRTHFVNDLHFDSLDAVEFTMLVEESLGVKIPDERIAELVTVQMVIEFVTTQKSASVVSTTSSDSPQAE